MKKKELIKKIADKTGETQKSVEAVLEGFADVVLKVLSEDSKEKITLANLGSFKVKEGSERSGISPITKERWGKPACRKLYFDISSTAKELNR